MDLGGIDVAAEAAAATSYCTYTDVELLCKRRIEAEGAAAARKRLQCLRVSENESRKRAHDHVSLRSWLTIVRNQKSVATCGEDGDSFGAHVVVAHEWSIVSVDTVDGGGTKLQVLSRLSAIVVLFSLESPKFVKGDDLDWTDKDISDLDDEQDFGGLDAGEAADLGLLHEAIKKKCLWPAQSYEMTRHFYTIWSAVWTWSEGMLANDGLLHQVRCLVCSGVEKKDSLMMPKRSTLEKHDQNSRHKKNLAIFAAKRPTSVLQ